MSNFQQLLQQAVQHNQVVELSDHPLTQSALKQQLTNIQKQQLKEHHRVVITLADMEELQKLTLQYGEVMREAIFMARLLERTLQKEGANSLSIAQQLNNEAEI